MGAAPPAAALAVPGAKEAAAPPAALPRGELEVESPEAVREARQLMVEHAAEVRGASHFGGKCDHSKAEYGLRLVATAACS